MPTPEETVKTFVKMAPGATYTFDGNRESKSAQLCRRKPGGGEDCIQVALAAKQLNITMQLPFDPSQTHMECVPIPK
ncbi:unnamed protein product [Rhizoctonia solani]|uniref:Uncharacterized protein n=1 Tax=Rhizoctonia solani TaxID=456999 RepID=A0A8H3GHW8_9AGAM|nr:unnamed protein product [Rhizoctonia solani]CAE6505688.1 unnamed protein product [Rhizoctonia solani]